MEQLFARHLPLKEFSMLMLNKLKAAKVLIVGLGALGTACAESLGIAISSEKWNWLHRNCRI